MTLDKLLLSRLQWVWVIGWHILLPALTVGSTSCTAVCDGLPLFTGRPVWSPILAFCKRIFVVSFGMGVTSGIVLPFQIYSNWSRSLASTASVLAPLPRRDGAWPAFAVSIALFALSFLIVTSAEAADLSVRLGDGVTLKPYVMYQLDDAGFTENRSGGQAAGFDARALRTGVKLEVADQIEAGLIWDFGHVPGSRQRLFEAQVTYIGVKPFAVTAGVFKPSFGLESMQGQGDLLFLERAGISAVTRGIAAGIEREAVQVRSQGDRYHVAVSFTAGRAGVGQDGDQRAVVARAVGLPVRTDGALLHLGVSGEYVFRPKRNSGELPAYSLSDPQELQIDDVKSSLSTGSIRTRNLASVGPEVGFAAGRLWVQSEWYSILLDRRDVAGGGTQSFSGWYAQAAYTVLGKPREWKPALGAWGAPMPDAPFNPAAGQFGSLELGARLSTVNLKSADIVGGQQRVWSAVANWRPIDELRFALQYEHASVDGGQAPRILNAVAVRAQLSF